MISFVTLLLGLTVGSHEVVVVPGRGVAAVEILLDSASLVQLEAPPWRARVDFGDSPLPHRLEAVARDVEGEELDRALDGETRLAEAVAIAGLTAAEGNRRRAVVLVLGKAPRDASPLTPQAARKFLAALRVPLQVWSLAPAAVPAGWETVTAIASLPKLERLTSRLLRETDRQQMVWVEGLHLPQSIRTSGAGDRFVMAGAAR